MVSVHRAGALLNEASCFLCRRRTHHHLRFPTPGFALPREASPSRRSSLAAPFGRICTRAQAMGTESYTFGPYKIHPGEVFYSTDLSYAMVNLRPLLPGHVLVCPKREVKRFVDLTVDETSDLWVTARNVGAQLERYHRASSLTFAIQDGPQAGQTVPHVHIHILPRKPGDFEKNDKIYDAIDEKEQELKETLDLDKDRKDRSSEEMACEADEYRVLFS
uniref:Bis(5'-adenosyl)-triphosphatase n=1 Tax=Anthurium amnicola TaxID=1678845 RepID=A0A1D1ZLP4_9ARAE